MVLRGSKFWEVELLPKLMKEEAVREIPHPTNWISPSLLEPKQLGGYRHIRVLRLLSNFLCLPK